MVRPGQPSLLSVFAATVERFADRPALCAAGDSVRYAELDGWSDGVAALLRRRGVRPGDPIGVRLEPGLELVATILGVLKAQAAYVPLDVRNPPDREAFIIADSGMNVVVGEAADGSGAVREWIGREEVDSARRQPAGQRAGVVDGSAAAYRIYTSGTTGRPKGVSISHGNVVALLEGTAQHFDFRADDRWLLFHSPAFDFSVWEIWGALAHGAALHIITPWQARQPAELARVLEEAGITVLNQTPTAFAALARYFAEHDRAPSGDLRYVVLGGERLPPDLLSRWSHAHGCVRPAVVNMYGITEATVHATAHRVVDDDLRNAASVIGRPLAGFETLIVADTDEVVAPGEVGELWLSGPQVAIGYDGRPDLTKERFVQRPGPGPARRYFRTGDLVRERPDGVLEYHGRSDRQVKLRGYRIELEEVESCLRGLTGVTDACATVMSFGPADDRLVCAVALRTGLGRRALRDHAAASLPSYMCPARFVVLPELPRTVNGKVDTAQIELLVRADLEMR